MTACMAALQVVGLKPPSPNTPIGVPTSFTNRFMLTTVIPKSPANPSAIHASRASSIVSKNSVKSFPAAPRLISPGLPIASVSGITGKFGTAAMAPERSVTPQVGIRRKSEIRSCLRQRTPSTLVSPTSDGSTSDGLPSIITHFKGIETSCAWTLAGAKIQRTSGTMTRAARCRSILAARTDGNKDDVQPER